MDAYICARICKQAYVCTYMHLAPTAAAGMRAPIRCVFIAIAPYPMAACHTTHHNRRSADVVWHVGVVLQVSFDMPGVFWVHVADSPRTQRIILGLLESRPPILGRSPKPLRDVVVVFAMS